MELQKITSFWRVSKDYDKLSLGDENGFLCEMVGQGSAQVLGENGLPKWSRIGSLVRWGLLMMLSVLYLNFYFQKHG